MRTNFYAFFPGVPSAQQKEPRYLMTHNSIVPAGRPDGVTLRPWRNGRLLAWDYTCASTLAPTYVNVSAGQAGAAATQREEAKSRKYTGIDQRYKFVPIGSETLGPWGESARSFLKGLGSRLIETTRDPRAASFLFQRLSMAIQRGNAHCILGSCPPSEKFEEIYSF